MNSFGGTNVHIIEDTNKAEIVRYLRAIGVISGFFRHAHFTNGTFTLPQDKVVPSTLAGFCCINQKIGFMAGQPIVIAVNSDLSMRESYRGKPNEQELNDFLEPAMNRVGKVLEPLAEYFQGRPIIGIYYDEPTPLELYTHLKTSGMNMGSLHKHGYGTNQNDKPIVGAGLFEHLFAFPLLNDEKPAMFFDTRDGNPSDRYPSPKNIIKLWEEKHVLGKSYLSKDGKIQFPVTVALQRYCQSQDEIEPNNKFIN